MTGSQRPLAPGDLAEWIGKYEGGGTNHEGEAFDAAAELREIALGQSLCLEFTATGRTGEVFHTEVSLISEDLSGSGLKLAQACSNIPGLAVHQCTGAVVSADGRLESVEFSFGGDSAGFRQVLTLNRPRAGTLEYTFAWAMAGEPVEPRSSATMTAV
ncbi:hypothetical protein [Amycolatopsis sp. WGS_07]|uniref:hypothetical protein n=1 Tax=Amycolatopsis sp. WGS_07 TaxID=3076764 RepID=UPI003873CC7F